MPDLAERWVLRFDPLAGGVAMGDPTLTREMRWLPPGTVLSPCPAGRVLHGVLDRCGQAEGHPGKKHRTPMGVVFELDETDTALERKH